MATVNLRGVVCLYVLRSAYLLLNDPVIADPLLTPLGESQANDARGRWETELQHGIPLPEKAFSSPLQRAMRTYLLTFDGIAVASKPMVLEVC